MTFEELQGIISEQFSCEPETVEPDTSLAGDLGADVLDLTELAWQIGEAEDLELSEEDLESLETVGELWRFIRDAVEQRDE